MFFTWTSKISFLPLTSGLPTITFLSKRPGLKIAGSRISTRLVAAITIIPSFTPKPSISTSIWLRVCSRSSCPPPIPVPLRLATASISSIKIIHGAFFFASANKSLTLDAPTPTNISTKSEPEIVKNGTPASPAVAFASNVLPVPGGPSSKIPFGILAPSPIYFFGFLRKSTISSSSSFSSSRPATLEKSIFLTSTTSFARLLPKLAIFPPPPLALAFIIIITTTTTIPSNIIGTIVVKNTLSLLTSSTYGFMVMLLSAFILSVSSVTLLTSDTYTTFVLPLFSLITSFPVGTSLFCFIVRLSMFPSFKSCK